ncbi:MAG TPA: hypothetical protein VH143_03945 [Kofleriaceae bacterium]|jgi:hypothetical protein|nr:hypothetical protein [Kofleriaceae bacterium]
MWRRLRYVLGLVALCAIATCPTARRSCVAQNRMREADQLTDALADRVAKRVALTGRVPPTPAPLTPVPSCCEQGGTCAPEAATWAGSGWRELEFSVDGPFRFSYEYAPDPSGMSAIVRAVGQVDCDAPPQTIQISLTVNGTQVERLKTRSETSE